MKIFWNKGSMALGDVVRELEGNQGWAYDTVKTMVRRMVEKGWVNARRVGNSFLYSPAVEKSGAVSQALQDFTTRVLDGMLSPVIAHFAEKEELSKEDVKELELLLDRYRNKRRGS